MNNTSLYRIGGIAAIASAVLYLLSFASVITGSTDNTAYILSSVLLIIAAGVLTISLMPSNRTLAILALVLLGGMTIWSMFLDMAAMDASWWPLATLYGLGFLLYGWLQYSGSARTLGILAMVTGALSVIAGVGLLAGMTIDLFGLFNLVLTIPFVIWLFLLGWGWLRPRSVA